MPWWWGIRMPHLHRVLVDKFMNQYYFFAENSPFLQHPLLTPERTAGEIDFILSQLNLSPAARVLDVGCGFGRHSLELARRGYFVVAIDPSAAMIAAAQKRAALANISVDFRPLKGESFTTPQPFDAALCLFTTLGQIFEGEENSALAAQAYNALKPGGKFVVEVPQKEATVQNLRPADKFGQGDRYTTVTRRFNAGDNTVTEIFTVISPEATKTYLLRYRLYSRPELTALLHQAGFSVIASYADYQGAPLSPASPTMLVISAKPERP